MRIPRLIHCASDRWVRSSYLPTQMVQQTEEGGGTGEAMGQADLRAGAGGRRIDFSPFPQITFFFSPIQPI